MKISKILLGALPAAMLFTACSNDEPNNTNGGVAFKGDGYVALQINLPTQKGTRANDQFDDGTANEYAVKNGAVVFFKGANEATAQFVSAYDLNKDWENIDDNDNDNITTSYLKAVKIENIELTAGENLYGLVMLNYSNVAIVGGDQTLTIGNESFSGTFGDFQTKATEVAYYTNNDGNAEDFFMTNAPVVNQAGGVSNPTGGELTTLVKLTGGLKATEQEAKDAPAGNFFVERAVAKATLDWKSNVKELQLGDNTLLVEKVEWVLANTEPSSYIVRNLSSDYPTWLGYAANGDYRFAGEVAIGTTSIQPVASLYRTYWCVDPHYDAVLGTYADNKVPTEFNADDKPLYCYENTFSLANQSYANTTRAVLKVTFKIQNAEGDSNTFWTVNGQTNELFTNVETALSYSQKYVYEDMAVKNAILDALDKDKSVSVSVKDVTIPNYQLNPATNQWELVDITFDTSKVEAGTFAKAPVLSDDAKKSIIERANRYYRIEEYTEGVAYYPIQIKHFGDDQTPWTGEGLGTVTGTNEAYGTEDANYLGRYGMVRNNWYEIAVTKINKLGKPAVTDVSVDNTSDDNQQKDNYLSFRINVLSWAKRVQNVEL